LGEFLPVVTIRIEVLGSTKALVRAYESSYDGTQYIVEGTAWLSAIEIQRLLDDTDKYAFWTMPEKSDAAKSCDIESNDSKNMQCVAVCNSGLTIVGMEAGKLHVVDRNCAELKGDGMLEFSREALRIARSHFPDLASDRIWKSELN
jgi:hypothetical protein